VAVSLFMVLTLPSYSVINICCRHLIEKQSIIMSTLKNQTVESKFGRTKKLCKINSIGIKRTLNLICD